MKRLLQVDEFTVEWVSALPIELGAAHEMLDEEYEYPPPDISDPNVYTLGRIGEHDVVLACLPAGHLGTSSAAVVATRMLSRFSSVRFYLMFGVGGGVPNGCGTLDIRLGDVVVSKPHLQHGGVVQHDFGKTVLGKRNSCWSTATKLVKRVIRSYSGSHRTLSTS
jgi:nucleoside phosphorylase